MAATAASKGTVVLVGTRKSLFVLLGDARRQKWRAEGPHFLGQIVNHAVRHPVTGTILVAARAGHLGPTVFRSIDFGKNWKEAPSPPAFPTSAGEDYGWSVNHVFWLVPGHASEPGVWYAGTSPHGLFRSNDDGATWQSADGFNLHPTVPSGSAVRKRHLRMGHAAFDKRRPIRQESYLWACRVAVCLKAATRGLRGSGWTKGCRQRRRGSP